jgi:hypothetical protein
MLATSTDGDDGDCGGDPESSCVGSATIAMRRCQRIKVASPLVHISALLGFLEAFGSSGSESDLDASSVCQMTDSSGFAG